MIKTADFLYVNGPFSHHESCLRKPIAQYYFKKNNVQYRGKFLPNFYTCNW